MKRKRHDVWDKPWVLVSVIAGVVIVLAMAGMFFMGGGSGSPPVQTSPATVAPMQGTPVQGHTVPATVTPGTTLLASGTPVSVPATTAVSVPTSGIFVRVSYIGGFSGTYGTDGALEKVRDSGDKIYALNKTSGNVLATFKKDDGSTRHEITVEIVRDGKTLRFAQNSSAYGVVSINYTV